MKNKCLLLLTAMILTACGGRVMSQDRFTDIAIGTPISEIEKIYGKPYKITKVPPNQQSYEYVERIQLGPDTVQLRRYIFLVTDGKVTSKFVRFNNPPGYDQIYDEQIYPNS